jgi:hypothetical protein
MSDDNQNPIYGDPFQALLDHFEDHDIRYNCKREERRAWFTMNSGCALQKCSFRFDHTGDILQIFIQYPVLVKEKFLPLAMEFITRANYGLILGNFEMDIKDGEVRYHISHLMPEGKLDDDTICRLFGTAMGTSDRYFGPFMKLLFAGETPEDAIFLAELDHHAETVDSKKRRTGKSKRSKRTPRKGSKPKESSRGLSQQPDQPSQEGIVNPQDASSESTPLPPASQADPTPQDQGNEGEDRKAA